ncbi:MAG: hypothetical protein K0U78_11300 [Actinomycetia bacterium]|nr:hypothetical protein [Actinomycetes bacterium]
MDRESGDDESGDRIQPGGTADLEQTNTEQGGDAQQDTDSGSGGISEDQVVFERIAHPDLGPCQDGHHDQR